ncbi:hypothetical protein C8Q79DRAFT_270295 [Trametes meyenii]|nr:hypothetical protein C8Q79DRAFT_270295 [Trametes meyenii]
MTNVFSERRAIVAPLRLFTLLCLPAYAAAQYGYYDDGGGTPGRVVAGIVVAVCFAILFLVVLGMCFRRRRRGSPTLPWQAAAVPLHSHNPNQGPYANYPSMNRYPSWGVTGPGGYQPPPGPPPSADPVPPPPYPGKPPAYDTEEHSGYGYPHPPAQPTQLSQELPQPGGFVAPQNPNSPPTAHVHNNSHSPWFANS